MDRYQLKNIIIIILLLVNGFLLGSLIARDSAARSARTRSSEQLVQLFAEDNLTLHPESISDKAPPTALTLFKDSEQELSAASFFLGKNILREEQGDGVYTTYTGSDGVALFRSDGSFDIAGTLSSGNADAQEICRSFCRSFSYSEPDFAIDEHGNGTAVAIYQYNKLPVFNSAVSFAIQQNTLVTVSGTLLPNTGTAAAVQQEPLSATAALIAFHRFRQESGASASSIIAMYPCYEMQSTASTPMSLSPSWCIVTDITEYYVNCISGTVVSG